MAECRSGPLPPEPIELIEDVGLSLQSGACFGFDYTPRHGDVLEVTFSAECSLAFQYIDQSRQPGLESGLNPQVEQMVAYIGWGEYVPQPVGWYPNWTLCSVLDGISGLFSIGHPAKWYRPVALGHLKEHE